MNRHGINTCCCKGRSLQDQFSTRRVSLTTGRQQTFSMVTARLFKEPCREEWFSRRTVIVQGSRSRRSDQFVNQDQISNSRREDTHSPVRIGASLRQSLIGAVMIYCNCKEVSNPFIQSRTHYYQSRKHLICDNTIQRIYLSSDDFYSDSTLVLGLICMEFF
jgi:hypothetical protein